VVVQSTSKHGENASVNQEQSLLDLGVVPLVKVLRKCCAGSPTVLCRGLHSVVQGAAQRAVHRAALGAAHAQGLAFAMQ
jgi:hypothetical protein